MPAGRRRSTRRRAAARQTRAAHPSPRPARPPPPRASPPTPQLRSAARRVARARAPTRPPSRPAGPPRPRPRPPRAPRRPAPRRRARPGAPSAPRPPRAAPPLTAQPKTATVHELSVSKAPACVTTPAAAARGQYGGEDETCPLSTGGRTRRVQLVRGEGGRSGARAGGGGAGEPWRSRKRSCAETTVQSSPCRGRARARREPRGAEARREGARAHLVPPCQPGRRCTVGTWVGATVGRAHLVPPCHRQRLTRRPPPLPAARRPRVRRGLRVQQRVQVRWDVLPAVPRRARQCPRHRGPEAGLLVPAAPRS